jgi:hypothetical protein
VLSLPGEQRSFARLPCDRARIGESFDESRRCLLNVSWIILCRVNDSHDRRDVSLSGPVDPAVVAAWTRIVDVQVPDALVSKETLDGLFEVGALDDLRRNQHGLGIVSANRQQTMPEHDRDFVDVRMSGLGITTNEDRSGGSVWGRYIVVGERKKQDGFTHFRISETHATREARLCVHNHSSSAHGVQRLVILEEE